MRECEHLSDSPIIGRCNAREHTAMLTSPRGTKCREGQAVLVINKIFTEAQWVKWTEIWLL